MILKHLVAILEMRMWYISFVHSHLSGEKCAVLHDHDLSFMLHNSKYRYLSYIVLTCHSSCCDSFHNLLAKRIRQWPNWPGLDISAYFSVCVPVQLQKIKKPGKMVLKIESHSTAMGLLSCIALLMGFTTGVPGDSCSQMT